MRLQVALTAASVVACASDLPATPSGAHEASSRSALSAPATLADTKITYYTLVTEEETSGQHTNDASLVCDAKGLTGCYAKEFLCSGWGVAMQGTGISRHKEYIHYAGGGTWGPGKRWLTSCANARFEYVTKVTGKSGKVLVPHYSIAVDTKLIPFGWSVWIDSEKAWFRADDTGGGIDGKHVDIFRGLDADTVVADWSTVYATPEPHRWDDPAPWNDGGAGSASGSTMTDSAGWPIYSCGENLDYWGTCDDGYAYWCEGDTVVYKACSDQGLDCGITSLGYDCLPPGSTSTI